MFNSLKACVLLVMAVIVGGTVLASASKVSAATVNQAALKPVTITGLCSDATTGKAQFKIGDTNSDVDSLTWSAKAGDTPTPFTRWWGYATVTTNYDKTTGSPAVTFTQTGFPNQVVAVNPTPCTAPIANCVDGYDRTKLSVAWSPTGVVGVSTLNSLPLCDDVNINLTSYTLASTYDGSGIFNASSLPQTVYDNATTTLKKGTTGGATLTVNVPNPCTDYQLDVYYSPEVVNVPSTGHGVQSIKGAIILHTKTDCTPGKGGETPTPPSTTVTPSTPAPTLTDTGINTVLPAMLAVVISSVALAVNFPVVSKLKARFVSKAAAIDAITI